MSLSNLYFRCCFEPLSEQQRASIIEACGTADVVDKSCSRESVNTCGMSIRELFSTYPIYNPQKGLYKSWGDIEFPWEVSNLTPNLLFGQTDDKWNVAAYRAVLAYRESDRVLVIEEDGYRISLYEAKQDILAISKAFDLSKWDKICHVETTEPAGLPTISELRQRYKLYELKLFDKEWEEYGEEWSAALSEQSLSHCASLNLTISELEKCLKNSSSDDWSQARIRREFFYRAGDLVLVEGECGDTLCVYISLVDIPATDFIYEEYADGPFLESIYLTLQDKTNDNKTIVWQRIYCVSTDENRCLGYQRKKEPRLGYQVVEIGSKGHYVEAPVERWDRKPKDLGEASELRPPAATLGPLEILALEGEKSPFREECEE